MAIGRMGGGASQLAADARNGASSRVCSLISIAAIDGRDMLSIYVHVICAWAVRGPASLQHRGTA
jgi:hypothetical protein